MKSRMELCCCGGERSQGRAGRLWKGVAARQVVSGRPSCNARLSKLCDCLLGERVPVTHACGSGAVKVVDQLEADVCAVGDKVGDTTESLGHSQLSCGRYSKRTVNIARKEAAEREAISDQVGVGNETVGLGTEGGG